MFKKLELNFLIMLLTTIMFVISISFTTIYVINYNQVMQNVYREVELARRMYKDENNQIERKKFGEVFLDNGPQRSVNIVFEVNNKELINFSSSFTTDDANANDIFKQVYDFNKKAGIIHTENSTWYYENNAINRNGTVVLIEITNRYAILKNLIITLISLGFVLVFVTFIISKIFAKFAIRPIEESYNKQKEFITDASHELRTPIAVINSNLEVVLDNENDLVFNQKQWLFYIKEEIKKMTELTSTLLYLSKTYNEVNKKEFTTINITNLLNGYLLSTEALLFEKNILIKSDIEDNLTIQGDIGQINQLITILLDNASKYTTDKNIYLFANKKNNKVQITVKNKCKDINPNNITKLFERFYKVDKSRTGENGYGLGLSIALSIIKNHNAEINAFLENDFVVFKVEFSKDK